MKRRKLEGLRRDGGRWMSNGVAPQIILPASIKMGCNAIFCCLGCLVTRHPSLFQERRRKCIDNYKIFEWRD